MRRVERDEIPRQNYILYNRLSDDADGTGSYQIDLPEGGRSYVIGNVIEQGPAGENGSLLSYGNETLLTEAEPDLFVVNNTFVNDGKTTGWYLFISAKVSKPAVVMNNIFSGNRLAFATTVPMTRTNNLCNNVTGAGPDCTNGDPQFVDRATYNYRLKPGSPAIDAGADPASMDGEGFPLRPVSQYVFPTCSELRPLVGPMDIGAYEFQAGATPPACATPPAAFNMQLGQATVVGGGTVAASIVLPGPAPSGIRVRLSSSQPSVAVVPDFIDILAGRSSGQFQVTTQPVESAVAVTITATADTAVRTASLNVVPPDFGALEYRFYLRGEAAEFAGTANGSAVTPALSARPLDGKLVVKGRGAALIDPGGAGVAFLESGQQAANTAYVQFNAEAARFLFDPTSGEFGFSLTSAYSFAQRRAAGGSQFRYLFDAIDASNSEYRVISGIRDGRLIFDVGAGPRNATLSYYVPVGQEETLFGKGVTLGMRVAWDGTKINIYVNGSLVASRDYAPATPDWTGNAAFVVGAQGRPIGYFACDDLLSDLYVLGPRAASGSTSDKTAPFVRILAPQPGSAVFGTVTVLALAGDNGGVRSVQFKLDGENLGSEIFSAPYAGAWNTLGAANGAHTLTAQARDLNNNLASASITVTVANGNPPSALTATPISSSEVALAWQPPAGTNVESYRIYSGPAFLGSTSDTSFLHRNLIPSATYRYQVSGVDSAGRQTPRTAEVIAVTLGGTLDEAKRRTGADLPRGWDSYQGIMWSTGAVSDWTTWCNRLREIGVTAEQNSLGDPDPYVRNKLGFYVENMVPELAFLHSRNAIYQQDWSQYVATHDPRYLVRKPSLEDPDFWQQVSTSISSIAKSYAPYFPLLYDLRDEASIGSYASPMDYDFSPDALRSFRDWLGQRYGSLDELNREWGSSFTSWDAVTPATTFDIKDREKADLAAGRPENYSGWADHREFMDSSFTGAIARMKGLALRTDPTAQVGIEGVQMASAFGGFDLWQLAKAADWLEPYDIGGSRQILRSFMPRTGVLLSTVFGSDEARIRRGLWRLVLDGDSGAIIWDDDASRAIQKEQSDMPITERGRALGRVFTELRAAWPRVRSAARMDDRIAIHYSQASIRAHWMFDSREDGNTWPRRFSSYEQSHSRIARVRDSFMRVIEDLGLAYNFVSYEQVENDELIQGGYKVLLLPQSVAMSDKEARRIEAFVRAGGTVIADNMTATMDQHLKRLPGGQLDDLFGLRQSTNWRAAGTGGTLAASTSGLPLAGFDPDLTLTTGAARYTTDSGVPVVIENAVGAGRAVYLNLDMHDYGRSRLQPPNGDEDRALFQDLLAGSGVASPVPVTDTGGNAVPGVRVWRYWTPNADLIAVMRNPEGEVSALAAVGYPDNTELEKPARIRILLGSAATVANVRTGDSYGVTDTVETDLDPWSPVILEVRR